MVPSLIEYDKGLALFSVYTMMGKRVIMTDKNTWFSKINRRFQKADTSYGFIDKGRLVVHGFEDLIEMEVDLQGFFYDPVAAGMISAKSGCDGDSSQICKPAYDYDMHLPGHISRRVLEIVRSVVFRSLGVPLDNSNNSMSDVQIKQQQAQNDNQVRN
jgi:hypothetical protein